MHEVVQSGYDLVFMIYQTFWASVIGFSLSGLVQAFVPRKKLVEKLGDHRLGSVARASFFGAVSSSCSFAASALAHSLYRKGADFTSSIIFMFASTNLVLDLGLVTWRLINWQIALAELIGGLFLVVELRLILPKFSPKKRNDAEDHSPDVSEGQVNRTTIRDAVAYSIGDFKMMRIELIFGFTVASILMACVPTAFWRSFFLEGHGVVATLENAFVAPLIACLSFVCSIGNVPLAASLWNSGISFGGTLSFILADLLSLPLILIYRNYFGKKVTLRLIASFWFAISLSGLLTQQLFEYLGLVQSADLSKASISTSMHGMFMGQGYSWGLTSYLDMLGLLVLVAMVIIYRVKKPTNEVFALDPICGMQVRKSDAPAMCVVDDVEYFFCMEGCRDNFLHKQTS